jgi:dihydroorotate dehydrogenase
VDPYPALYDLALSRIDPELAHRLGLSALRLGAPLTRLRMPRPDPALALERWGVRFPNPLGVAAGLDKHAVAVPGFLALGFGHVEVGTVTPRPQPGNPRPRLFRLPEDRALINRLGFPSEGMEAVAARLAGQRVGHGVVGINLGKNRDTPLDAAAEDYLQGLARLGPLADYAVVNVSSPNTPGLRSLQGRSHVDALCAALLAARPRGRHGRPLPLLLKIAPDLDAEGLDDLLDVALARGLDGLVVSNTTVTRDGLRSPVAEEVGGLSGAPLLGRADALLAACRARVGDRLVLVGVGGIFDAEDAWRKLLLGASLVQVYTGFVYRGPALPAAILDGLRRRLERFGLRHLDAAIGSGIR